MSVYGVDAPLPSPREQARIYLETLFGRMPQDQFLVPFLLPKSRSRCASPSEIAPVVDWAIQQSDAGQQVYIAQGTQLARVAEGERGGQDTVGAIPGFWVDVDVLAPPGVHKAGRGRPTKNPKTLPGTVQDVMNVLVAPLVAQGLAEPTMAVWSGYGLHLYWLFAQPWVLRSPEERARARAFSDLLQARMRELANAVGWHLDNTSNLDRILRIAGTRNWKLPTSPVDVILLGLDLESRVTLEQVERLQPAVVAPPPPSSTATSSPTTSSTSVATPSAAVTGELVRTGKLKIAALGGVAFGMLTPEEREAVERVRQYLVRYQGGKMPLTAVPLDGDVDRAPEERIRRVRALLEGTAFEEPGGRDQAMFQLASITVWLAVREGETLDSEALSEIFRPSMDAFAREPDQTLTVDQELAKVIDKLSRALKQANDKIPHQERKDAWIRAMEAAGAARGYATDSPETLAAVQQVEQRQGVYNDDDLRQFCVDQGCSMRDWPHRWIIQSGDAYYAWRGVYQSAVQGQELLTALRDDLSPAIPHYVRLTDPGSKSGDDYTNRQLIKRYGSVARIHDADMRLRASTYDGATMHFREAVCPPRALLAQENVHVGRWLEIIGRFEPRFLDWLACVPDLNAALAALYLVGRKETGKSLLSLGVTGIWSDSSNELANVISVTQFNEELVQCPVCVADERLDPKQYRQDVTSDLRRFVTAFVRVLNRKHKKGIPLFGYLRAILSANNERMLQFAGGDLTHEDMEAIAQRILVVRVPDDARDYLQAVGGKQTTDRWIQQRTIAKHVLYLRQTRTVEVGMRMLVEGRVTEVHRSIALRDPSTALVCEWILKQLLEPSGAVQESKFFLVGDGRVLVSPDVIQRYFDAHVKSEQRAPALSRVVRGLQNIAKGKETFNDVPYVEVDTDQLLVFAQQHMLMTESRFREILSRPLKIPGAAKPTNGAPPAGAGGGGLLSYITPPVTSVAVPVAVQAVEPETAPTPDDVLPTEGNLTKLFRSFGRAPRPPEEGAS